MNKKKNIITLSIVFIFIIIPITVFTLQKLTPSKIENTVIIDNISSYNNNIDSSVFSNITKSLYQSLNYNVKNLESIYHGVIRDGSFNKDGNTISFIIDISSIKMSWSVGQTLNSDGSPSSDAYIGCISKDEAIYPITTCIDQNSGFMTEEENALLNITKILPLSGPSYKVTYEISDNKCVLTIKYYTSNGKTDALSAIQKLGYDPSNYTINYIDKS